MGDESINHSTLSPVPSRTYLKAGALIFAVEVILAPVTNTIEGWSLGSAYSGAALAIFMGIVAALLIAALVLPLYGGFCGEDFTVSLVVPLSFAGGALAYIWLGWVVFDYVPESNLQFGFFAVYVLIVAFVVGAVAYLLGVVANALL